MSKKEIWKDIPGWEGYYQVSSYGNFRSIAPQLDGSIKIVKDISDSARNVSLSKIGGYLSMTKLTIIVWTFLPDDGRQYVLKDKNKKLTVFNLKHSGKKRRKDSLIRFTTPITIPNLPNEEWVHLLDFEGYYMVSNLGRFKKIRVGLNKSIEDIRLLTPKDTKQSTNMLYVTIPFGFKSAGGKAASWVFDSFYDEELRGLPYTFKDGDENNFSLANLVPRKGVRVSNKRRPLPSRVILDKYYKGVYIRKIAEEYGVVGQTIRVHIKHVGGKFYTEKGLVEAYYSYKSVEKISEDLGLDFDFVKHVLVRHNVINKDEI